MKPNVLLTTIAALLGLYIIDGAPAQAGTKYFSRATADWSATDTWSTVACGGTTAGTANPVAGDTAIICCGDIITVDGTQAAATVIVQDGGTLTFNTGAAATLTIDDSGGDGFGLKIEPHGVVTVPNTTDGSTMVLGNATARHVIEGELGLPDSGSTLQFSSSNTVISGDGMILGGDDDAAIKIATGLTLKMETTIEGNLRIEDVSGADGVFVNSGMVHANVSGVITLDDLTIRGKGLFKISHASGEIEFEPGASACQLGACFDILNGQLDVQDNVITVGHLRWVDGAIVVASGKEFRAN